MTMVACVAARLVRGWQTGTRQSTDGLSLASDADAYAVQQQVADTLGWFRGGTANIWKLGGAPGGAPSTARVPEAALYASGWQVPSGFCFARGIEAEIVVRLGRDLDAGCDLSTVYSAIDAWMPGIELCDTRWDEADAAGALLRLADQQLSRALILGEEQAFTPNPLWRTMGVSIQVDQALLMTGCGSHPFGDPLSTIPWLARHTASQSLPLRAGDLIATGSWSGLFWAPAGGRVAVSFVGAEPVLLLT